MFIAHRGVVKKGLLENTIPAFLAAIKSDRYEGFELDVYTSKDKEFVVHHDILLDGKFIWKYNYKELKKKGIVKLEQVLKLKTDKIILIEIKDINMDIIKFSKLLKKYQNKNIYVMSFFKSVIAKFQDRTFKVGVLNYILNSSNDYPYDFIGVMNMVATPTLIRSLKEIGLEVFIYALNKKDNMNNKSIYYIVDDIFFDS